MKIRTDFVTNSSSSGYIIIRLTYRNGESMVLETEWDSGWGDYFSSYGLDDMLHKAKNGVDLLAALRNRIDNWESLVENKTWTADFRKEVASLSSLDSLKSISIEEHDNDPEREDKKYTYRFIAGNNEEEKDATVKAKTSRAKKQTKDNRFSISDGVLRRYNGMESEVIIPDTVTKIAMDAFMMTAAKTIIIPSSVKSIQPCAMARCETLERLILGTGTTVIPSGLCSYCTSLQTVVLSDSIEEIKDEAFKNCRITSVTIPKSVKVIGDSAFADNPLDSVVLSEGLAKIGCNAFKGSNIREIVIPKSCQTLGKAFCNGTKLKTLVILSDSVRYLPGPFSSEIFEFDTSLVYDDNVSVETKKHPDIIIYCEPSVKNRLPECWQDLCRPLSEWNQ